jgi:hypothetical protein
MTQSRKDALQELLAKVEADNWNSMRNEPSAETGLLSLWQEFDQIMDNGSLNAALALHNAVLPHQGWEVYRTGLYRGMIPGSSCHKFAAKVGWGITYRGYAGTPARAWLCAILQALIADCDAIKPPDPRR